ncbi:hypothetical protein HanXRQr2_Chr05g0230181 [Helianthus annuus]|uniref:Uncharacterized protein n=1 Tax=Helianthus annuus TaxID=4232 RepID=A0A9K3J2H7_HELAN|nr:hypothetical protein HanXRQr2_Chr05g0230181 [Helianthus annuus]
MKFGQTLNNYLYIRSYSSSSSFLEALFLLLFKLSVAPIAPFSCSDLQSFTNPWE